MEKDRIFFGESGLTTTSANYLANIAKEKYILIEDELNSVQFYNEDISLLSSESTKRLSSGITEVKDMYLKLQYVAKYKSFIAWVREAIKAKERLIKEASKLETEEIAEILGISLPEVPIKAAIPTPDDVIAAFNIKRRNYVYYLQTLCAEIGSYIHPEGAYAKARKMLEHIINNPNMVSGSGRDTVLYSKTPSIAATTVDATFFELQKSYREYQAELNTIKHEIEVTISDAERKANEDYSEAVANYKNEMSLVNAKVKAYRDAEVLKAQSLKIVIPDSLRDIYEELNAMGK